MRRLVVPTYCLHAAHTAHTAHTAQTEQTESQGRRGHTANVISTPEGSCCSSAKPHAQASRQTSE
eukprot:3717580-Rhodomonas_salina.1